MRTGKSATSRLTALGLNRQSLHGRSVGRSVGQSDGGERPSVGRFELSITCIEGFVPEFVFDVVLSTKHYRQFAMLAIK